MRLFDSIKTFLVINFYCLLMFWINNDQHSRFFFWNLHIQKRSYVTKLCVTTGRENLSFWPMKNHFVEFIFVTLLKIGKCTKVHLDGAEEGGQKWTIDFFWWRHVDSFQFTIHRFDRTGCTHVKDSLIHSRSPVQIEPVLVFKSSRNRWDNISVRLTAGQLYKNTNNKMHQSRFSMH